MSAERPTIYDVARAARVSHQTVSRVVNDHPAVRAATRRRVHQAIHMLGYKPNKAAQSLASQQLQAMQTRECGMSTSTASSGDT